MALLKNDKRRKERLALNMPVDLKRLDLLQSASIDDLTPEGVFIATEENFNKGARLELHLHFPPGDVVPATAKNATVVLQGEVVWSGRKLSNKKRQTISGIGVRFVDMDADSLEQVLALYERIHAKMA